MRHATGSVSLALGMLLAGCGGDGTAADRTAAITISTASGPAAGVDVVFHDAAGAPTRHLTTGSDGRVSAEVVKGGMITALLVDGSTTYRATIVGVEPGDELTFRSPRLPAKFIGTVHVTVPPYAGAAVYVLQAPCATVYTASITSPVSFEIYSNCLSADGTLQLLVTVMDSNGNPIAYAAARDLTWVEPMNVVLTGWRSLAVVAFDAVNVPAGGVGVLVEVGYDRKGRYYDGPSASTQVGPGGEVHETLAYAPDFADRLHSEIQVGFGKSIGTLDSYSTIIEHDVVPPAWRSYDLTRDFLPPVSVPTYDATDPARLAMLWTTGGSLAGADGAALRFVWRVDGKPQERWDVLVPPDVAAPFQLPALPPELASFAPPAGAELLKGTVWFLDADWVSSYQELRKRVGLSFVFNAMEDLYPAGDARVRITRSL